MSKTAIIQLSGKQYFVKKGDVITADATLGEEKKDLVVTDVLLLSDEKITQVGQPLLNKASVTLSVIDQGRGKKIMVMKYKSKSRYRKVNGHRQPQTKLTVTKITG